MKIAYLANIRLPTEKAHGKQIVSVCGAFKAAGVEISLIVPKQFNQIKGSLADYYQMAIDFPVYYLNWSHLPAVLSERLTYFFNWWWFPVRAIFSGYLEDKIIYTRDPFSVLVLGFAGYQVFYEDHGWPKHSWWYRACLKKAKGVIAITRGIAEEYERANLKLPLIVAHDGVGVELLINDITQAEAREKVFPFEGKLAVYTGSLSLYDWKGVDILLETSQLLKEVQFVVVGGSPVEVRRMMVKYPHVKFVSQVNQETVRLWQRAADVLILPNKAGNRHSEKYTSPLKLFEYMAAQRPIIASNLPAIREILNEGNAYLVEPNNPVALKAGIELALSSPESITKAQIAFNQVVDYTWEKRARKIIDFITGINR